MLGLGDDAIIATSRLILNPLRVDDADEMVAVLADPELHEFTGGEPATLEELRVRYAVWVKGSGSSTELWMNWIVRRVVDGAAIGTVQATIVDPDAESTGFVAWIVGTAWQRQGYATEAAVGLVGWLRAQGIESVVAHIHADNVASGTVAMRLGMRPTNDVVDGEVVWRLH